MADPDENDPLSHCRALFDLPPDVIYLDGNSLGPLPHAVKARLRRTVEGEWGRSLIRAWNEHHWIDLPARVGARIARLIGASPECVTCTDSTSVNLAKVLDAAMRARPERPVVLSDSGNFPTDLYVAQGMMRDGRRLELVPPEEVADAISDDVGIVLLTEVDYRTGRRHDMAALTARAHAAGALAIWDLAHSAGAFAVDLTGAGADFAVGCGYKYLNGGPGAPAFLYVRPDHLEALQPFLAGWMGHAAPFDFDLDYRPATGIDRLRVGTPPILSMAALDEALALWDGIDLRAVEAKSRALTALFIEEVDRFAADFGLEPATPREPARRGSQVSYRCPEGYAVMQALIADGVIGDFRSPDIIRFGFAPLYLRFADVREAAAALHRVLAERRFERPEFRLRSKVT